MSKPKPKAKRGRPRIYSDAENKERQRAWEKTWRKNNPERHKEAVRRGNRKFYAKHREKILARKQQRIIAKKSLAELVRSYDQREAYLKLLAKEIAKRKNGQRN